MMKKIGILTFHCAENYGAFLQTYASSQMLKEIEPEISVSVINYNPLYLKEKDRINIFAWIKPEYSLSRKIKSICLYLITVPDRIIKKRKFRKASRTIPIRGKAFTHQSTYSGDYYDYVFLGSDQIWNSDITNGIDPVYYGSLSGLEKATKFSYGASLGGSYYKDKDIDKIKGLLSELKRISVREKSTEQYISQLCEKRVSTVVDPVLLLDPQKWFDITQKRVCKKRYVLVYQLRDNAVLMKQAQEFANSKGLVVLHFGDRDIREIRNNRIMSVANAGPFDFINYIRYSEAVFTDSFHATCFSMIYERPFFTYLHETRSSRIIDLGIELGFQNFIIPRGKMANLDEICCIPESSKLKLKTMRNESINYISETINNTSII